MSNRVLQLPGRDCVHYRSGRCLYEEDLNPGLHEEWRCAVIARLERQYDLFIEQADNFRLDDEVAGRIWEDRLGRILGMEPDCGDFSPGGPPGLLECQHGLDSQCVLTMPVCEGRCRYFKSK